MFMFFLDEYKIFIEMLSTILREPYDFVKETTFFMLINFAKKICVKYFIKLVRLRLCTVSAILVTITTTLSCR